MLLAFLTTKDGAEKSYYATKGDTLHGALIIVLVNRYSMSAAESLASALQEHNRAIVLGTTTFGKSTGQRTIPVKDSKASARLTIGIVYGINKDRDIANNFKVIPDIIVKQPMQLTKKLSLESFNQKYEIVATGDKENEAWDNKNHPINNKLKRRDYQLYVALTLLRDLSVKEGT